MPSVINRLEFTQAWVPGTVAEFDKINGVWGYVNTRGQWFGSDLQLLMLCINALYDNFCVHVVLKP